MIFDENSILTGITDEMPLKGKGLSDYLLTLLNKNPTPGNPQYLKLEFENIFLKLPELATEILTTYDSILKKYNLNPGNMRLYMVGGRLKGKPLTSESDIDLLIWAEDPTQSADSMFKDLIPDNPQSSDEFRKTLQRSTLEQIKEICHKNKIPNKFHILNFGTGIKQENNQNKSESLLIGIYPQKIIPSTSTTTK